MTDKRDFANMFGKNVYEVKIPSDAKLKRILPSKACSVIWDIIRRALVKVGIDYGNSDLMFKVDLHRRLDKARYSPYDAIMEASALVGLAFPEKAGEYYDWVAKIATQKFFKYDVVVFAGTNNPIRRRCRETNQVGKNHARTERQETEGCQGLKDRI